MYIITMRRQKSYLSTNKKAYVTVTDSEKPTQTLCGHLLQVQEILWIIKQKERNNEYPVNRVECAGEQALAKKGLSSCG